MSKWPEHIPEAMIDSILQRRVENQTAYVAPGAELKWRARNLVDIHWHLTGIETPSESYNRIMSCLIDHANPDNGRCQVKQKLIAAETGYCTKTVRRAVEWWVSNKFLIEQDMGIGRSRAYHPQWDLFGMFYVAIAEHIKAQKETWDNPRTVLGHNPPVDIKGSHAVDIKGSNGSGHHAVQYEPQSRTSKNEPQHEMAHASRDAEVEKRKKGFQGKAIPGNQSSPPDKYGPIYWGKRVAELEAAVVAAKTEEGRAELDKKLAHARAHIHLLKARGA